jgi:hypothetical protein
MLIIVDKKIPAEAKEKLSAYGSLLQLETEGILYPAIAGHPDIFFCKTPQTLVVSPSLPDNYIRKIKEIKQEYVTGNHTSHIPYPASVHYNDAVSDHYLVHRLEYTDPAILQNCHTLIKIPVKQAYTRCNLLLLNHDHYITSDPGIHRNLQLATLDGIFVSATGIILPGFLNGFIGGAMGLLNETVFINGNLSHYQDGETVRAFLEDLEYRIVELYDGPLIDGGGILFI